ncbi:MAG: hypothetical protein ACE5GM_06015 [bacterium]
MRLKLKWWLVATGLAFGFGCGKKTNLKPLFGHDPLFPPVTVFTSQDKTLETDRKEPPVKQDASSGKPETKPDKTD